MGGGYWNPCFSRNFHDWELATVEPFLQQIQVVVLNRSYGGRLVCKCSKDEIFFVKSFV